MRLKKHVDILAFMEAVQQCGHDVFFDTPDGDHLNLKSTLSQFVFASAVAARLSKLDAVIRFEEGDRAILTPFLEE